MSKSLNILGCAPTALNILLELAEASNNSNDFIIHHNMEVEIDEYFIKLPQWNINEISHPTNLTSSNKDTNLFTLGVIGIKSKPLVYQYFKSIFDYQQNQFPNLIHPTSFISPSTKLNYGMTLEPLSTISSCSEIGFGVTIKRQCSIGHHNKIGDYVTLNPGVTCCGHNIIGKSTMIGAGTTIKENISIGENCIIGMGSVVLKDIPANSIAFGNPCKVIRKNI